MYNALLTCLLNANVILLMSKKHIVLYWWLTLNANFLINSGFICYC
jgi:hypothetical protein